MKNLIYCQYVQDKSPGSSYIQNRTASWLIVAFSIVIIFWYVAASIEAYHKAPEARPGKSNGAQLSGPQPNGPQPNGPQPNGPQPNGPQPNGPQPNGPQPNGPQPNEEQSTEIHSRETQVFKANLLSGLLASLVIVSLTWGDFPQAIEGTYSQVLALSQASALGWLDYPPREPIWSIVPTKILDASALALNLWALHNTQDKTFAAPVDGDNGTTTSGTTTSGSTTNGSTTGGTGLRFRPATSMTICSASNFGFMFLSYLGLCLSWRSDGDKLNRTVFRVLSFFVWFLFFGSCIAGVGVGMDFADWGCRPFTFALWLAPIAVIVGAFYSGVQVYRRLREVESLCPVNKQPHDVEQNASGMVEQAATPDDSNLSNTPTTSPVGDNISETRKQAVTPDDSNLSNTPITSSIGDNISETRKQATTSDNSNYSNTPITLSIGDNISETRGQTAPPDAIDFPKASSVKIKD